MSNHPQTKRHLVIAAVMASMAMVAIEATIVSTAMPQIVTQLGGLRLYSWVFSSFLLAQTAMTVVFGKLADLYGRKPTVLVGIAIFLIGSIGAGFAWSMPAMIAFRLIQGMGAGAIQPVTLTIVADLYPARERGKIQGYLASVWAISAVIGPMAGGLLIRDLSWSWIFWINVPIGFLAAFGFITYLHEEKRHQRPSIDIMGAVLFTIAIGALMMALTDAGSENDGRALFEVALCVVAGVLFVWHERRVSEPMISFALWSQRPIAACNAATVMSGMALMGLTTFLPMYVQGVLHQSPVVAGLALTMVMLGWPSGATFTAKSFHRLGLRRTMVAGSFFLPLGAIAFALLQPDGSPVTAGVGSLVMGLGMGIVSVSSLILIQEIVQPQQRGSATASNLFSRNLGSTLGAAIFGAVLNFGLSHFKGMSITSDQLRSLLDATPGAAQAALAGNDMVRAALHHSLHLTFLSIFVICVGAVLSVMMVPHIKIGGQPRETSAAAHLTEM
ncbi:MFS transporter [Paraburkholderia sp. Tr-20389]|uniref:MDR family MFS transporter n=1 Tax=Paraburkholderia sp. Tr-20389 TaxID=2703903 RepID=UPI001980AD1A|nr:MDR family MFS transporter [Paraburkholderia sp. Tr-20389]MBN3758071.1 MFS transporter [Paraburkholderia sp. Tr-20389]